MTLNEFVNTMTFGMLLGTDRPNCGCTQMSIEDKYNSSIFLLPCVVCVDGFSISIQVHHGAYCASENGTRTFGTDWQLVEWGFPSSGIDAVLYKAESYPTTKSVGGYVDINRMETLIQEHGGIDLQQTLKMEIEKREMLKKC